MKYLIFALLVLPLIFAFSNESSNLTSPEMELSTCLKKSYTCLCDNITIEEEGWTGDVYIKNSSDRPYKVLINFYTKTFGDDDVKSKTYKISPKGQTKVNIDCFDTYKAEIVTAKYDEW